MTGKELEQIYNEAYKAVYWTAMAILKNEADAEDIVQDTFVSFIEAYSEMTDTTKATALLKKIAANKCLNRIKLARTDAAPDEFFEDVEAVPEDFLPDTIVESAEMRKIIMDIISNSLSEDIRRTLILFYFDEMSTKEIAETLGVPEGTVRRRLNFARNKIKKEVEKYEEDNNTKLFGMAALPFLSKLFIKEAEQVPFKAMPASLISTLSASAKASTQAGIKAAASAAQKGTGIVVKNIVIGSIAAVVAVGTAVGIFIGVVSKKAKPEQKPTAEYATTTTTTQETTTEPTQTTTQETSESTTVQYKDDCTYLLTGMTDDEIIAEVTMLLNMKPDDGMTTSDYEKKFKFEPQQTMACSMIFFSRTSSFHRDAIMSVRVVDVKEDMDWKVWYTDKTRTSVKFVLMDEDRARRIYDILSERLKRDWASYYDRYKVDNYDDGDMSLSAEKDTKEKTLYYSPLYFQVYENKDDGSKCFMISIQRPSLDAELGGK